MTAKIYVGDALAVLRTLPDRIVHCVVTSPPYFALRDYGTATWDGGDSACDHLVDPFRTSANINDKLRHGTDVKNATKRQPMGAVCTKCGARRVDKQIGLEDTPEQFVVRLVEVFREVRRVLRDDGVCWVNIGDSFVGAGGGVQGKNGCMVDRSVAVEGRNRTPNKSGEGLKPKDLIGIPWRLAFALQADGWWLRSDCIWAKPNPMPESVEDRPTKAHEYVFMLTKTKTYFYDAHAVRQAYAAGTLLQKGQQYEGQATKDYAHSRAQDPSDTKRRVVESMERRGGANLRTVWTIPTQPFKGFLRTVRRVRVPLGAVDGDTKRTTSPDCPMHGDSAVRASTLHDGARAGDASSYSARSADHHALAQRDEHVPTDQSHEPGSVVGSLDSQSQRSSSSATPRSTRSRRTDPALSTTSPCSASGGTAAGTGGTSEPPSTREPSSRTRASSSEQADSAGLPSGQSERRSEDTSSCSCEYYREEAGRVDHFATFPKALADRCILAGTSAHGACPDCAAPWERVVVKSGGTTGRSWNVRRDEDGQDPNVAHLSNTTKDGTYTVDHQGWHPTCACRGEWFWDPPFRYVPWLPEVLAIDDDEGIVVLEAVRRWRLKDGEVAPVLRPCVVMDPFTGAGTTALSAASLSRDFVGVELNLEFARMAARRIDADMPLFGQTILVVP